MGRGQGHVTYFLNFGTTSVTFEWVKLDTFISLLGGYYGSHLSNNEWPLKGRRQGHVAYFFYFGSNG